MRTLALAWRNLLRNRRRSATTLLAMVLGLTTVLLFGGYIRDIQYAMRADFVARTGHLQIQHRDFYRLGSGNPAAYGIKGYQAILDAIRSDAVLAPMLAVATPTLQFGAIAGNFAASVSHPVFVTGVVIEDQNLMNEWNEYDQRVLSRPLSLTGTSSNAALLGTGVARVLRLCGELRVPDCTEERAAPEAQTAQLPQDIADLAAKSAVPPKHSSDATAPRIELLASSGRGAPNVASISVARAEFQGVKELDDAYVGLHLSQAQALVFGAGTPQVTAIAVQLHKTAQMEPARVRLAELLRTRFNDKPLAIIDYETLNPFYGQTLAMFSAIFSFISVLIGSIVLFTVSNTMSMSVIERTSEIGTLRAIGQRRCDIRSLFVAEGFVLGCVGAVFGALAAIVAAAGINLLGLTWTPPGRIEPVPLAVMLSGEYWLTAACTVGLVVVATLSATVPAMRGARMNIVDALRHV